MRELLIPVYIEGNLVYTSPSVMEIQAYCQTELSTLWEETKRFVNPSKVYVDLSDQLFQIKKDLLSQMGQE